MTESEPRLISPGEARDMAEWNAAQINGAMAAGDYAHARRCLARAKRFTLMALRLEAGLYDKIGEES